MIPQAPIPRLIHQMWIDPTGGGMPDGIAENVALWRELNPTCSHRVWALEDVLALCASRGRGDVAAALRACRFPTMQADLARYFLLLTYGGFWVDLKLRPKIAIPPALFGCAAVLVQHFPTEDRPEPGDLLASGFIGATPGVGVMAFALGLALRNVQDHAEGGAFALTGPGALSLAWRCFRLADPDTASRVPVLPHAAAWGGFWEVVADSYNPPGMHWSVRQGRDSPFQGDAVRRGEGLHVAVPGRGCSLGQIVSRQGFHPFETEGGFAWIMEGTEARVLFDAFLPFDRMRVKLFVLAGYRVETLEFRLNGVGVPVRFGPVDGGWVLAELGPFAVKPAWNQLAIVPGYFTSPGPGDRRQLSVAVATIDPLA